MIISFLFYRKDKKTYMFNIRPTPEQKEAAKKLVEQFNFGHRGRGDGDQRMQETGILGQICVADLFGLSRPSGEKGFDGGFDFIINGKKVDIKTMGRMVDVKSHYVHNFVGYQLNFECDYYIFASYNKRFSKLQICGVISKDQFLIKADHYNIGDLRYRDDGTSFRSRAPLYEIKQSNLIQVKSKEDILKEVK